MIVITKFLLIIMSAAVLLLGGQQIIGNNILERGPVAVLADEDDCANDPNQLDCNNPGSWEGRIFPDEPTPPAPSCGDFTLRNSECDWDSQQVYEVYQDSCGNYDRRNYQTQPGQCGATAQTTSQGGDFTFRYPECDWDNHQVREVWQDSSGNYQYRNVHSEPGQCGATASQPPAQQQPVGAPAANVNANVNTNANVNNNVVYNSVQNTVNQSQSQTNNQTQTVTVQQPAQPVQGGLSVRFATVDCPSGTNKKVSGNEIICEIPQEVRVAGVIQTPTKELPKTGLPLLAWAAGAFIPAGLGLKRFGKGIAFDMEDNANYLWEERQYKQGYSV